MPDDERDFRDEMMDECGSCVCAGSEIFENGRIISIHPMALCQFYWGALFVESHEIEGVRHNNID